MPFFAFVSVFLVWPTATVFYKALRTNEGHFTGKFVSTIFSQQQYRHAFWNSTLLSFLSAVLGGLIGLVLTYAIVAIRRPRWLRNAVVSFSAVAANLGGLPLAFMFIASIGISGMLTRFFQRNSINLYDKTFLYTGGYRALTVVYLYFQIPLMVIVMLPAVDGLKKSWREAAENLGASGPQYWRRVGIPVLWPAFLGGVVLLFANSFSAYATAQVIGYTSLASVQIGFFISGNTLADQQQYGYAIASWMILIVLIAILLYQWLRNRTTRWLQ